MIASIVKNKLPTPGTDAGMNRRAGLDNLLLLVSVRPFLQSHQAQAHICRHLIGRISRDASANRSQAPGY